MCLCAVGEQSTLYLSKKKPNELFTHIKQINKYIYLCICVCVGFTQSVTHLWRAEDSWRHFLPSTL